MMTTLACFATRSLLVCLLISLILTPVAQPYQAHPSTSNELAQPAAPNQAILLAADLNTLSVSPGGLQPNMLSVTQGEAITITNTDTRTRRILVGEGTLPPPQNVMFLPMISRSAGANLAAPVPITAQTAAQAGELIVLAPGQSVERTFNQVGNITVIDADTPQLSALILVTPTPLTGQAVVNGSLLSFVDKQPLAGAQVVALDTSFVTTTQADGRFSLALPPGDYTLALFASGYTFANRKVHLEPYASLTLEGVELVQVDSVVTSIGAGGGTATNSSGDTTTVFTAGAVGSTKAVRLTVLEVDEFAPGGDYAALPGAFTNGNIPIGFVMFEPDGAQFSGEVVWTIDYTGSLPVGFNADDGLFCYYWLEAEARWGDPVPGEVVDLGGGKKGLRATLPHFSSYGYSVPPEPGPKPPAVPDVPDPNNDPTNNPNCPDQTGDCGSQINLVTGALIQEVGTLGLPNPSGLPAQIIGRYNSLEINPRYVVSTTFSMQANSLAPDEMKWRFEIAGRTFSGNGAQVYVDWDGRDANGNLVPGGLITGKLWGIWKYSTPRGWTVQERPVDWPILVHNNHDLSPIGQGWFSAHDTLLIDRGDQVSILQADGRVVSFTRNPVDETYIPQIGELSTLARLADGQYVRTMQDGSVLSFNLDGRLERVQDRNGNFQLILYESNGRSVAVGSWGLTTRIRRITDNAGNTFDYAYNSQGFLESITDSAGRIYSLEHDSQGNLTAFTNPLGGQDVFTYDARSLMSSHTDPRGSLTTYTLDDLGRIVSRTWPQGTTLQAGYTGSQTTITTDGGRQVVTTLDEAGNPVETYNGVYSMVVSYNAGFLPVSTSHPPKVTLYDDDGRVISEITNQVVSYRRDGPHGEASQVVSTSGANTTYEFDPAGNVTRQTDALGQEYSFVYNAEGVLVEITDPLGRVVLLERDGRGLLTRLTDPLGQTFELGYDSAGNLTQVTDPNNHSTQYEYDLLNRMSAVVDALNGRTALSYDANGNLTSYTDPSGRGMTFGYDNQDQLSALSYPGGAVEQYAYDADGHLARTTDPLGRTIDWTYDAAGRPIVKEVQGLPAVQYSFDELDQLTGLDDGRMQMGWEYVQGSVGQPDQAWQTSAGLPISATVDYLYNSTFLGGSASAQALPGAQNPSRREPFTPGPSLQAPPTVEQPAPLGENSPPVLPPSIPEGALATPYQETLQPNGVIYVRGFLDSNVTWTAGNTYVISDTSEVTRDNWLYVRDGVTLTVEAGTVVKVATQGGLDVRGSLMVSGTEAQPVIFTSLSDDQFGGDTNGDGPSRGVTYEWYGIGFNSLENSEIRSAVVRYAHTGIQINGSGLFRLDRVRLESNFTGIYASGGRLELTNSSVYSSTYSSAHLWGLSQATITDNNFVGNTNSIALEIGVDSLETYTIARNQARGNGDDLLGLHASLFDDFTWSGDSSLPLYLSIDVYSGTLTLPAGTIAKGGALNIWGGKLVAQGTAGQPIILTSPSDDSVGGDTNNDGPSGVQDELWGGIQINDQYHPASAFLQHVILRGSSWGLKVEEDIWNPTTVDVMLDQVVMENAPYGLHCSISCARVSNSVIRDNQVGVFYQDSAETGINTSLLVITDSQIIDNQRAIYVETTSAIPELDLSGTVSQGNLVNAPLLTARIRSSLTWKVSSLYAIDYINIEDGSTLTITPGTVMHFAPEGYLSVQGSLYAVGTGEQPIIFTSISDDRFSGDFNLDGPGIGQPGDWGGIGIAPVVEGHVAKARISQAIFANAGGFGTYYGYYGVITCYANCELLADHTTFTSIQGTALDAKEAGGSAPLIQITESNFFISSSSQNGVRNYGRTINATQNYWGAPSGPTVDDNPEGTGARILNNPYVTTSYQPFSPTSINMGDGRLAGIRISSNANQAQEQRFEHDDLGQATQMTSSGFSNYALGYEYDAAGRLVRRIALQGTPVSSTYAYDTADHLSSLAHTRAGGPVWQETYAYDPAGNLLMANSTLAGNRTYTYSALNRLASVTSASFNETYAYDAAGNRTQAGGRTFTYNAAGQLTGISDGTTLAYDLAGNLISRTKNGQTTSYTWDNQGRLVQINYSNGTHSAYQYDDLGRRISRRLPDGSQVFYIYVGDMLMQELDEAGNVIASYTYDGLDRPVSMWRGGQTYYYLLDFLGSVVGLVSSDGNLAATYQYDPWGNLLNSTGSVANPLRFAAREYDPESGLHFLRARYYDPQLGRFISRDPLSLVGGGNLYAYALNNPVRYVDSSGTFAHIVAGAGIGAVTGAGMGLVNGLLAGKSGWDLAKDVAIGSASGAAGGALTAALGPFAAPYIAGAAGGLLNSIANQLMHGCQPAFGKTLTGALTGGAISAGKPHAIKVLRKMNPLGLGSAGFGG